MITKINTHAPDALNRFLYQFKGLPKIESLHNMQSKQIQDIEDSTFDFLTKIPMQTATGIVLDRWGIVLNEQRNGESDSQYRTRLFLKVSKNLCTGTSEDLIKFFNYMLQTTTVQLSDLFPAVIYLTAVELISANDPAEIKIQLQKLCPAGVRIGWLSIGLDPHPFAFATIPNGNARGFDSYPVTGNGGVFVSAY